MGLAIVTGATGGLGYETALGLARAGYDVWLTGRDAGRGAVAVRRALAAAPGSRVRFALLDVASLASVAAFAETVPGPVAVLVNNAGVMALPQRTMTADGFERQFGTNYLGHFALTARLLTRLREGCVVNVSSLAHRRGAIHFDDPQGERSYDAWGAYGQSKLAMLMFGIELQARSDVAGWGVRSVTAHPGWSATRIVLNGPGGGRPGPLQHAMQTCFNALGQSAAAGARPILLAATDAAAQPGGYYGPCCLFETRGAPAPARIMPQAKDKAARTRLWALSEALTDTPFQ